MSPTPAAPYRLECHRRGFLSFPPRGFRGATWRAGLKQAGVDGCLRCCPRAPAARLRMRRSWPSKSAWPNATDSPFLAPSSRSNVKSAALGPAAPVKAIMDQVRSRLYARRPGDPGALHGAVPQQRRRQSPGVLVLERAPIPVAAVSRQALSTGAVRSARRDHARLQHSRQHDRLRRSSRPRRSSDAPIRAVEWRAADVPDGRYRVRVWHPLLNEPREVERHGRSQRQPTATLELRLSKALRPAPLGSRPHRGTTDAHGRSATRFMRGISAVRIGVRPARTGGRLGTVAGSARREFGRPHLVPRQRPGQAALR